MRIGGLSDLVNEWVQRYFDHLSRGTIAEGAVIRIERIPTTFRCDGCGHVFPADPRTREAIRCPLCSSAEMTLATGRECFVQQIEVADVAHHGALAKLPEHSLTREEVCSAIQETFTVAEEV